MSRKEYGPEELLDILKGQTRAAATMLQFPDEATITRLIAQVFVTAEHLYGEERMRQALAEMKQRWDRFFQGVCQRCGGPLTTDANVCIPCGIEQGEEDMSTAFQLFPNIGDPPPGE
jgi:hypothetical protein